MLPKKRGKEKVHYRLLLSIAIGIFSHFHYRYHYRYKSEFRHALGNKKCFGLSSEHNESCSQGAYLKL